MQSLQPLLPNDLQISSKEAALIPLIVSFTIGGDLNYEDRNADEEKHVNKAAFIEGKLQDEPKD